MGKANISFPEGMLEDVDARAAASGTTRSAFIQEATALYVAELDRAKELAQREVRIAEAIDQMREIGSRLSPGPSGTELVRHSRDAAPAWLEERPEAGHG